MGKTLEEKSEYISLQETTEYCDYSQEYLSLRARQGKLKAVKFGRNWVTKKEWLNEYLKQIEGHNNHLKIKKVASPKNLPIEKTPVLRFGFLAALVFVLLTAGIVFGKDSFRYAFDTLDPHITKISQATDLAAKEIFTDTKNFYSQVSKNISNGVIEFNEKVDDFNTRSYKGVIKSAENLYSHTYPITNYIFNGASIIGEAALETSEIIDNLLTYEINRIGNKAADISQTTSQGFKEIPQTIIQGYTIADEFTEQKISLFGKQISEGSQEVVETMNQEVFRFDLNRSFGLVKEQISQTGQNISERYLEADEFVENKIFLFGRQMTAGKEEVTDMVKSAGHNIIHPWQKLPTEKIVVEKSEKIIEKEIIEKQIIKEVEVSKITRIEPVKEITKETIITKIDDEELKKLKAQIAEFSLWGTDIEELRNITKKLQSRPTATYAASAPIYIASQGLQVGGTGSFASLGVSGSAGIGHLGVGGSTSLGATSSDYLTVNATSSFKSPVTISNTLSVSGAQTFTGAASFASDLTIAGNLIFDLTNDVTIQTTDPAGIRTYTIPDFGSDDVFVGLAATQALTNKTYEGLTITTSTGTLTISDGKTLTASASTTLAADSITFEGTETLTLAAAKDVTFADAFATSGAFPLTLVVTDTTDVTLPTTGTLATLDEIEILTNKTLTLPIIASIYQDAGKTKLITFQDATGTVVTDTNACSNIEGTALSITDGTLNVGGLTTSEITDGTLLEADLDADESPTDNDILTFDTTGANFSWQTPSELSLQPLDGTLTAFAGLTIGANELVYGTGADAFSMLAVNSTATNKFLRQVSSGAPSWQELVAGDIPSLSATYATLALNNLASVAINLSLVSDTANADDLGTEAKYWKKLYLGSEISFEGATDNEHQLTISVADISADRAITFRDAAGTVILSGDTFTGDVTATLNTNGSTALAIGAGVIIETDISGDVDPTDGDFLQYDSTGTNFTWRSASETLSDIGAAATDQTMYIGTTQVAINRGSGTLNLAGIGTLGTGIITSTITAVGTAQTIGGTLINTTAAASGAQQYSPVFELEGQGWKTAAGAASQEVKWGLQTKPVEGVAAPTGVLDFLFSVAEGAYSSKANLTSVGVLTTSGLTIGSAAILEAELEILDGATLSTTQLNYLSSATGMTGTTNTNLVFSTSPTFVTPEIGAATGTSLTNSGTLTLASSTAGVNITTHTDATDDFTVNTSMLVVEGDTGKVGIGTATPQDTLDIRGDLLIPAQDIAVDCDGADGNDPRTAGTCATISDGTVLDVVESADQLCADSLTSPTCVWTSTAAGVDTDWCTADDTLGSIIIGAVASPCAPGAHTQVGSTWAFYEDVTADNAYTLGEDLYIDKAPALKYFASGGSKLIIDSINGLVGIGNTTPGRTLDVLDTTSNIPQIRLTHDVDTYAELYVDSTGDLSILLTDPSHGNDIIILDENLQICTGGSFGGAACPAFGISGNGNLIVEDEVYIGGNTSDYVKISGSEIIYAGTAKPKRTIILTAAGAIIPSVSGAAQTRIDGTYFSYYTLDFSQSADEYAYWEFVVPDSFDATTNCEVTVYWTASAGTTPNYGVSWKISALGRQDDEPLDSVLGADIEIEDALIAVSDIMVSDEKTLVDGWAVGDYAVVKVYRDVDAYDGGTNLDADARLLKIKIEYSVTKESD